MCVGGLQHLEIRDKKDGVFPAGVSQDFKLIFSTSSTFLFLHFIPCIWLFPLKLCYVKIMSTENGNTFSVVGACVPVYLSISILFRFENSLPGNIFVSTVEMQEDQKTTTTCNNILY